MARISIIIPIYNSEQYLEELNKSLVNQSFRDLEIIYVNDHSPDNSKQIIESFLEKDYRIKLFNKTNGGAADALNYGTAMAKGEFLMYLDADDTLALNACERAMDVMNQKQVDLVFWAYTKEYKANNKSVKGPRLFSSEKLFSSPNEMQLLRRRMIGLLNGELKDPIATDYFNAGWGKLFRTIIIKENNIQWKNTEAVGSSDVLFNAQLMPHIKSAYYLPEFLLHYTKDNNSSLTKTYGWTLFAKMKQLHKEIEKVIILHYSSLPEFWEALSNRRALSLINLALSVSRFPFHPESIKCMRSYLSDSKYRSALKKLPLSYLPIHYKVFFMNCRMKNVFIVLIMGKLMRILR